MASSDIVHGSLNVSNEIIPFLIALTDPESLKKWVGLDSSILKENTEQNTSKKRIDLKTIEVTIKKENDKLIQLHCAEDEVEILINFEIDPLHVNIQLQCLQFNIYTFLQGWIYRFYRLQELVESGEVTIPELSYSNKIEKNIIIQMPIKAENTIIFRTLTEKYYLSQLFSKYPESYLEDFLYNWGWIDEGPSNLISWKQNKILIHDFLVDFKLIGYIKWEIKSKPKGQSFLTLTHKDIFLTDEIDPLKAYNSYKHGWMYYLAKVKDLSEHGSFTVHFIDEIID